MQLMYSHTHSGVLKDPIAGASSAVMVIFLFSTGTFTEHRGNFILTPTPQVHLQNKVYCLKRKEK